MSKKTSRAVGALVLVTILGFGGYLVLKKQSSASSGGNSGTGGTQTGFTATFTATSFTVTGATPNSSLTFQWLNAFSNVSFSETADGTGSFTFGIAAGAVASGDELRVMDVVTGKMTSATYP